MLEWMLVALAYGLAPGIDNAAHLGGMIAGIGLGWVLGPLPGDVPVAATGALALALLVIGFALSWRTRGAAKTIDDLVNEGVEHAKRGEDAEAIVLYRRAIGRTTATCGRALRSRPLPAPATECRRRAGRGASRGRDRPALAQGAGSGRRAVRVR